MHSDTPNPIAPVARLTDLVAVSAALAVALAAFALIPAERFPAAPFAVALVTAIAIAAFLAVRLRTLTGATDRLWRDYRRASATLQSLGDGVITTDRSGRLDYLNPKAEAMLGHPAAELHGRSISEVLHGATPAAAGAGLVEPQVSALRDGRGGQIGSLVLLRDVSQIRTLAGQLDWHATHDTLTGLVNRAEFERRAHTALMRARDFGEPSCLCMIDLDQFKVVNDLCGHRAGDQMLRQLAGLLAAELRRSDTVARWGGDEFVLLLDNCSAERGMEVCRSLLKTSAGWRFSWEDKQFHIGLSIGLVKVDGRIADIGALLGVADTACQSAKERGQNTVERHEPGDQELARRRGQMSWAERITRAVDQNLFCLQFQRYANLSSGGGGRRHGEVLLRMRDDGGGIIQPGTFLPAAEHYRLMPQVDRWVVRTAFAAFAEFGDAATDRWSVNLSGQSLSREMFEFVAAEAKARAIDPRSFCFEITETAAIHNVTLAAELVAKLRGDGFTFALDDFGSGLSSFSYLKTLPVDYVKIDGSFVRNIPRDPVGRAVVKAVHEVAGVMGLRTIAEFVEDDATLGILRDIGVDFAQGYAVARPRALTGGM